MSIQGQSVPTGTVTFLFTDIEGSTKTAQEYPDQWESMRARHHEILQSAMDAHNGYVFQIIGDAFCVAFHTAIDGLNAATDAQRGLQTSEFFEKLGIPMRVRMGIHTGKAELQAEGDYNGYLAMSRVQRLMSAGHGGQILISMTAGELVRDELPQGIVLRDMGEHRLKDLIRPEHIYQLDIAGLPVEFPALKTLDQYRHNLPTQLTSFIGHAKEMAAIKQALVDHRLVTLTGSGGVGKTRLSLQVAADALDSFPSGIWFVELGPLTDPDLIPQTILAAADMQTQPGRSALDSLTDFLREKTCLLVLDNCEHLIDSCAKLADKLLSAAPDLKILASSREALGIKGEQAWRIPSLSLPDVKHLPPLDQLSQYEAVRLFIDRALLVQPHFAIHNDNAPAVAQICHRLGGIPLAIELAAARVRMLSVEQISARLDDRFRLLTGGSRTAIPRQQTLRALIDWSYDLLPENERILFRRLSVFAGGCTLEAAEQVCGDDDIHVEDVLDLLAHLVDKSLVTIDEPPGQLRYRMLETVRQYAQEKLLETGEGERVRIRHLACFLRFAEEAEPYLRRTEQIEWLARLETDYDNLRTALEWGLANQPDDSPEAVLRLSNALTTFWYLRGYWLEAKSFFARALVNSAHSPPSISRARAFTNAARFESSFQQRLILCNESLALCDVLGDKAGLAGALFNKGMIAYWSDGKTGKTLLKESLKLYTELGDANGIAGVKYHLGQLAQCIENDFLSAIQYFEECIQFAKESGNRRFIALANMNLAGIAESRGDLLKAQKHLNESLALGREMGDKHGVTMYLQGQGEVFIGLGKFAQAQEALSESLSIAREMGSKIDIADGLSRLSRVARFQNEYEKAAGLLSESLEVSREIGDDRAIAWSLCRRGELARLQKDFVAARAFCHEALEISVKNHDQEVTVSLLEEFASQNAEQGQAKQSATLFGAAEALRETIHVVLFPVEQTEIEKNIAAARAQLDEEVFSAAWADGSTMTMDQAIEYVLKELEQ